MIEIDGTVIHDLEKLSKNHLVFIINLQKAKNESLQLRNNIFANMLNESWERIEELDGLNEIARSNAIREFAEKLKELYTDESITDDMHCSIGVIKENINDLVKEMVGENND